MLSVGDHDFDTPSETVEACVTRRARPAITTTRSFPAFRACARRWRRSRRAAPASRPAPTEVIATPGGQARALCRRAGHARPRRPRHRGGALLRDLSRHLPRGGRGLHRRRGRGRGRLPAARRGDRSGAEAEHARDPASTRRTTRPARSIRARASRPSPSSASSTISGCSPTRSTGRSAAASMSRRARCPAWPSARWSSTRCRRATA